MPRPPATSVAVKRAIIAASAYLVKTVILAATLYASPLYWKQEYHNSALSGSDWVQELIHGHPERIRNELGVRLHVFLALVQELRETCNLRDSKHVALEEQVATFLYMCVTGLGVRHVGERFQRSNETISKYFRRILHAIVSPAFYSKFVHLPYENDPVHQFIRENTKFFPFFDGVLGAMDGTHINCCPTAAERHASRNRKGGVTQNCLACCSFDMRFQYMLSGWEGCAADAEMYEVSRLLDLKIPEGKFYLADAGFGICDALLVPYRGTRYHLQEWGRAGVRPANREELFNLRHASARNVVERIFGILKKRFGILTRPSHFDMDIQARIPPALAAVHNFILENDWEDIQRFGDVTDENPGPIPAEELRFGTLSQGPADQAEKDHAAEFRDQIAQEMWESYQQVLLERGEDLLE